MTGPGPDAAPLLPVSADRLAPLADASGAEGFPERPQITTYPLHFTGTAGEYFRIWIVNVALTIVTLGVYTPWARVRTRRYFYAHTWLDGHNFEYTASPWALLRGYLIVAAVAGLYSAASQLNFTGWEWVVGIIALLFVGLYPWLVRQSMRFLARSTVHRGLSFRFLAPLGDAYVSYGLANVVASVSGSLALPWAWFMQRRYQAEGLSYGGARGRFRGDLGRFYLIGLGGLGVALAGGVLLAVLAALVTVLGQAAGVDLVAWLNGLDISSEESPFISGLVVVAGVYATFLLLYGLAWQYIRAATMEYVLNHFELGGVVRTRATFRPWRLVWIGMTNIFARFFSLGLLTPWAAVRVNRYILENVQVRTLRSLDDFHAERAGQESALGEAATELLDINVGF